ncbi:cytochrome c maturation protein CcmE [Alteromonadaceae bacterium M269]|nr:cytochrome c maturation protein CcmE [Alteromonadaceae bacterium M269]
MNPRRKQRMTVVGSIIFLVGGAVALMLYALNQNIDLFLVPSEVINGKDGVIPQTGQRLRVGGMVVPGSVKRDDDSLDVTFDLTDTGPIVSVSYQGILPDLFREGQGIIITGVLEGANKVRAEEVLAKHDEEYMPAEMAEKVKGIKHVKPSGAGY